jgi:hypothetical protein
MAESTPSLDPVLSRGASSSSRCALHTFPSLFSALRNAPSVFIKGNIVSVDLFVTALIST